MKKRVNPWEESLQLGEKAHGIAMPKLKSFLTRVAIENLSYEKYPEIQRAGIDALLKQEKAKIETKARKYYAHRYNDILIETVSVLEKNIPGWIYTSKADWLCYVIFNKQETDLIYGWVIKLPEFRSWFLENKDNYKPVIAKTQRNHEIWHTVNIPVPIEDFPKGTIFQFIKPPAKGWGQHNKRLDDF